MRRIVYDKCTYLPLDESWLLSRCLQPTCNFILQEPGQCDDQQSRVCLKFLNLGGSLSGEVRAICFRFFLLLLAELRDSAAEEGATQ